MNEIINFIKDSNTYNRVIEIINNKLSETNQKLPETGYIAGGAVANVLDSLWNNTDIIVNDIDIFVPTITNDEEEYFNTLSNHKNNGEGISEDNTYRKFFEDEFGNKYSLLGHKREKLFNFIDIVVLIYTDSNKEYEQVLIDGFDINNCQASIDLSNKKIYYTNHFISYLKNREMKITYTSSPLQTAIRLIKKKKELNCYCNIEHEMRLLTLLCECNDSYTKVGVENFIKYYKLRHELKKWFNIERDSTVEWDEYDDNFVKIRRHVEKSNIWFVTPNITFRPIEYYNNSDELFKLWYLLYTPKKLSQQNKINKLMYYPYFLSPHKEKWGRTNRGDGSESISFNKNPFYNELINKPAFYNCDFNDKHIHYILDFINEHPNMRYRLNRFNNIYEIYVGFKLIKKYIKKEGQWVIGLIENNFGYEKITPEWIEDIIENEKTKLTRKLIDPIDLSGFEWINNVTELTTSLMLREEGVKMGHCVGGYSNRISDSDSRIFHIEYGGYGSTAQIGLPQNITNYKDVLYDTYFDQNKDEIISQYDVIVDGDYKLAVITKKEYNEFKRTSYNKKYKITQHYGRYPEKGNKPPTEEHKKIVIDLIDFLNENHLPLKIKELYKISKNEENIFNQTSTSQERINIY